MDPFHDYQQVQEKFQELAQIKDPLKEFGQPPQTATLPDYEPSQDAFVLADRRTPQGQKFGYGDARRGGRLLGFIGALLCSGGVAAEIASILLAAVAGEEQADKLNWPLAKGLPTWNKCEYLPNSDAPATPYGAGVAIFYHSLNVLIFTGLVWFLARFTREPHAAYSISTSGIIMTECFRKIRLGTLQGIIGALLSAFGFFNILFGWHWFLQAARAAFSPAEKIEVAAHEYEEKLKKKFEEEAAERQRLFKEGIYQGTAEQISKQLEAYIQDGGAQQQQQQQTPP